MHREETGLSPGVPQLTYNIQDLTEPTNTTTS